MRPVFQTKFPVHGNCWRAAIASILEIDIDAMPAFEDFGHRCLKETRLWLKNAGYGLLRYESDKPPAFFAIAIGKSPRNPNINHAIVVKDGYFVHDPYSPSICSIELLDIQEYYVLCRLDDAGD
jgi:hypothetical protein